MPQDRELFQLEALKTYPHEALLLIEQAFILGNFSEFTKILVSSAIDELEEGIPAPISLSVDDEDVMREATIAALKVITDKLQRGPQSFRKKIHFLPRDASST